MVDNFMMIKIQEIDKNRRRGPTQISTTRWFHDGMIWQTNHYFNHFGTNTKDQRLIESIIIESIKVYGIDVNYMPQEL